MPFITSLTEHHAEVVSDTLKSEPCCLGVDEAGRGPVLGPMVYGIAYCPVARNKELKSMGMDDSKKLTSEQREGLFDKMKSLGEWLGWSVRSISPDDISGCMLQRSKYNLNELSHDAAIYLIQSALNRGVNVTEVYVDTVGSPEKYQQKLAQYFPGLKITVAKKADSLYPSVSAASIAAKVTRDLQLKNWLFQEHLEGKIDIEFGSGYPADPLTKKWLLNNMDSVFGFPRLIRFSWQTCSDLLAKEAVTVVWPEDLEDEQQQGKSNKKQKQVKLSSLIKPKSTRQHVYGDLGLRHVKDF